MSITERGGSQRSTSGVGRPRIGIVRCREVFEPALYRESRAFVEAGYHVDIFMLEGDGHGPGSVTEGHLTIHRLPGSKTRGSVANYVANYGAFFLRAARALGREHRRAPFQMVHVMSMPDFLVFCTALLRRDGVRIALSLKEPTPELTYTLYGSRLFERAMRLVEQLSVRFADVIFTVTPDLTRKVIERGADPDKVHTLLVTPEEDHYQQGKASPRVDPDRFVVISHGTIEERWGYELMIEAIDLVRADVPEVELRLTGRGTFLDRVMEMVEERGLEDHVTYLGWLDHDDVVAEIAGADVGVVAQLSSPYSNLVHTNKMYEFIIVDTPCVASRLQATAAAFDEDELLYFEPGHPKELAEALVKLHRSPRLRDRLVERARAKYDAGYSWNEQKKVLVTHALDGVGVLGEVLGDEPPQR